MDARDVLAEWIADPRDPVPQDQRRGKHGRLLMGTTPERYFADVFSWLDFLDKLKLDAFDASPAHVETWLDGVGGRLGNPETSERSRARRVSALSAFYTYAHRRGIKTANPAAPTLRGKPHALPPGLRLTLRQQRLLWQAADEVMGDAGPGDLRDQSERNWLLVYLLLAGLRPMQLVALDLGDVVREQPGLTARVRQRGGGLLPRVPLGAPVEGPLRAYLPKRSWHPPESTEERGPLLTSYRGGRLDVNSTPNTVLREVVRRARGMGGEGVLPARGVTPDVVALSPTPWPQEGGEPPRKAYVHEGVSGA